MPPDTGSPAPQTDTKAGEQTTEQTPAVLPESDDWSDVMNRLPISDEIKAQLTPKSEEKPEEQPEPEQPKEEEPQPEPEPEPVAAEQQTEDDDDDEEEEPHAEQTKLERKLSKRNAKLRQQRRDQAKEIETLKAEVAKFHEEQSKSEQKPLTIPSSKEQTEAEEKLSKAEETIAWCEANADGGTTIQGDKEVFLDADQVSKLKRFSEREALRLAPEVAIAKRDAKQAYEAEKSKFDGLAKQSFPKLFDKSTPEYQKAREILRMIPEAEKSPYANWMVGVYMVGMQTILNSQKDQSKPNGEKKHRDISERAFEPRVPVARDSVNPPSRNERPSPQKKLDQAMSRLMTEGGQNNLVAALEAMDETQPKAVRGHSLVET